MNDRKRHWQKVYRDKQADEVSWFQPRPELSLSLIDSADLKPGGGLIDVGGGASTLIDHLLDRGYRDLTVLDVSGLALEMAQQRLGDSAEQVGWLEADITTFRPDRRWRLWHDRAVFHFLTDKADRERYRDVLLQALDPGGQLVIAAFAIGGPTQCSGLDIVQYDAAKLLGELGEGFELLGTRQETHITPGGQTQAFNYFHLQRWI